MATLSVRRSFERLVAIAAALCGLTSSGHAQDEATRRSSSAVSAVSGCYDLAFDSWADTSAWHGVPIDLLPPRRVLMDTVLDKRDFEISGRASYGLHAAPGVSGGRAPGLHTLDSWSFESRDSITVAWSDGFTGTGMWFRIVGDTLRGRIGAFTDLINGDPSPHGNAAGIRVACDAQADSSDPYEAARLTALRRLVAPKPGDVELAHKENAEDNVSLRVLNSYPYYHAFNQRQFADVHRMIARFTHDHAHLPTRLQDLAPYAPVPPPDERWMRDFWSKPIRYVVSGSTYELRIAGERRPGDDTGTVVSRGP